MCIYAAFTSPRYCSILMVDFFFFFLGLKGSITLSDQISRSIDGGLCTQVVKDSNDNSYPFFPKSSY